MRKFAVAVAVVALVAFTAPAFAATNPFMDVPMNHWAYDAIGQLAAHGILSGYPDGTYKGKQPTTRYEMASALARALAVVDMTKASKQDVEMLKKLVVEFRDELEALGVKVADLDERVSVLEDRLGGWHIHGILRLDVENYDNKAAPDSKSDTYMQRARLFFERYFGEDESMFFRARLDNINHENTWQQFYVTMPFFFDSRLTVGRFLAYEELTPYYLGGDTTLPEVGGFNNNDSIIGDRQITGLGLEKTFGMGSMKAYVAHSNNEKYKGSGAVETYTGTKYDAWEFALMGSLQFTEQFGFDVGGHLLLGDEAEPKNPADGDYKFKNMWTVWAGLRFDFNDSIALKGIFYHQKRNGDVRVGNDWRDRADAQNYDDGSNHWRVVVDVDQEMLKFTSLWLEYGQYGQGFTPMTGFSGTNYGAIFIQADVDALESDLKYWRVALGQEWNEKWATHLFYYGYDFDKTGNDLKEWGLGVKYQYNPNVAFGLNFVKVDWDEETNKTKDDHVIRFRTQVTF